MHLYVLTRGCVRAVREWREGLSNCYLPMEIKNEKGEKENALAQLQIRPIELYEIVFPEEHEKTVMGLVKPCTDLNVYGKKWGILVRWIVKKLKLAPPLKDYVPSVVPPNPGVSAYALGTKKDVVNWEKQAGPESFLDKGNTPREFL